MGRRDRSLYGSRNERQERKNEDKVVPVPSCGSKGREIYETMQLETPSHERNVQQVVAACDQDSVTRRETKR